MALIDRATKTLLSDLKMQVAAGVANSARNARFWETVHNGAYNGPRIVAEGDSWFCYPTEFIFDGPTDIVARLGREFAVATEAVPGDIVAHMRDTLHTPGGLLTRVSQFEADIVLLSGGGNDLLGDGQLESLLAHGALSLPDYFKTNAFKDQFWGIIDDLNFIARQVLSAHPTVKIVLHGYDYAVPSGRGPWLLRPLERIGVPANLRQSVIDRIVDWFNRAEIQMVGKINADFGEERALHVDLRNSTLNSQWYDEIHPTTVGFAQIARRFREAVLKAYPLVA